MINDVCKFPVVTILKFFDVDVIDDIVRVGLGSIYVCFQLCIFDYGLLIKSVSQDTSLVRSDGN